MKKYIFEGYSDDTFGEYGVTNVDYDNCANGKPIRFSLKMPNGSGLLIAGCYDGEMDKGGQGWMIGVCTLSEEHTVNWKISMDPCFTDYRNQLTVEAPDEAVCSLMDQVEEED